MAYKRVLSFADADYRVVRKVTVTAETRKDLGITSIRCGERRPGECYIFTETKEIDQRELPGGEGGSACIPQRPLDLAFNAAVMTMAKKVCPCGYDVAHDGTAPESLQALQDHAAKTGRILVDGRHSERTIFGDPEYNWAFRAWHDWTHLTIRAEFTLDGELAVAHRQIEDLKRVFGHDERTDRWTILIMSEVYGQARYHEEQGEFPEDPVAFTKAYMYMTSLKYMTDLLITSRHKDI